MAIRVTEFNCKLMGHANLLMKDDGEICDNYGPTGLFLEDTPLTQGFFNLFRIKHKGSYIEERRLIMKITLIKSGDFKALGTIVKLHK